MVIADLERKARTTWRREGPRRAALVYARICEASPESATHWALQASALLAAGRREAAADCLRTATWLRLRAGQVRKAASLGRMLLRLVGRDSTAERALDRAARLAA